MKNKLLAGVLTLGLSLLTVAGFATTTFASSSSKTTIGSIVIDVDASNIEIGSTDTIYVYSKEENKYQIGNHETGKALNMESKWAIGTTPRFSITIKPEEGYKFDTNALKNASYYSINTTGGETATFVKASGGSNSVTLTVKLPKLKGDTSNLGVSSLEWEDETAIARWEQADSAQKYYVRLYKGNTFIKQVETTSTSYDFAADITSTGEYRFKVRAHAYGKNGEYDTSDDYSVDQDLLNTLRKRAGQSGNSNSGSNSNKGSGQGAWMKDSKGWWYANPDRSYPASKWMKINGLWYYFDANGYMKTGWIEYKGSWYFCTNNGDMLANTRTPDGYWVNGDGAWDRKKAWSN